MQRKERWHIMARKVTNPHQNKKSSSTADLSCQKMRLALLNQRFRKKVSITEVYTSVCQVSTWQSYSVLSYARVQRVIERLPESRKTLCDHEILLLRWMLKQALGYFKFVSVKDENYKIFQTTNENNYAAIEIILHHVEENLTA